MADCILVIQSPVGIVVTYIFTYYVYFIYYVWHININLTNIKQGDIFLTFNVNNYKLNIRNIKIHINSKTKLNKNPTVINMCIQELYTHITPLMEPEVSCLSREHSPCGHAPGPIDSPGAEEETRHCEKQL